MQDWISVKDKIPENDTMVLVWNGYITCPYLVASYHVGHGWIDYDDWVHNDVGSYWMPLPEPPKY